MDKNTVTESLAKLYSSFGYAQYRMEKFEEYDLYARHKEFLPSGSVLTFTDTNGKLMALKPDVTLSIVKNSDVGAGVRRVYYSENVYRVAGDAGTYREIPQVGLEALGDIDDFMTAEVIKLASRSLGAISHDGGALDVSHLGLVSSALNAVGIADGAARSEAMALIGAKNMHDTAAYCRAHGADGEKISALCSLMAVEGAVADTANKIKSLCGALGIGNVADEMMRVLYAVGEDNVRVDFSCVGDTRYYSSFVFGGYVRGVPGSVLSGGCYDGLMARMGKNARGLGFAVYVDMLDALFDKCGGFDADAALLYGDGDDIAVVMDAADRLRAGGLSVAVCRDVSNVRACRIYRMNGLSTEEMA